MLLRNASLFLVALLGSVCDATDHLDRSQPTVPQLAQKLETDPLPKAVDPGDWKVRTETEARSVVAMFVFGNRDESPPPTTSYPYRARWSKSQQELGAPDAPPEENPRVTFVDCRLVTSRDRWSPYVARNDGRQVWQVRWRFEHPKGPLPLRADGVTDLRFGTTLAVWLDPVDGAFLRAMLYQGARLDPNEAMPKEACDSEAATKDRQSCGPEVWKCCLVRPPTVPLVLMLAGGAEMLGVTGGVVSVIHAAEVQFSRPLRPCWLVQLWGAPPSAMLGPAPNARWLIDAETGHWMFGTGGQSCEKPPKESQTPAHGSTPAKETQR